MRVESLKQICTHITSSVREFRVSRLLSLCNQSPRKQSTVIVVSKYILPVVEHCVILLVKEPINGGGRCLVEGFLPVPNGIISLVCNQTGETYLVSGLDLLQREYNTFLMLSCSCVSHMHETFITLG